MASLLSAASEPPNLADAPARRSAQTDAASAICRMFAPESVYDASFDDGALAAALAEAAVDVTRHPEPSAGPFSMATALQVPAHAEHAALVGDLASHADVVLVTLDWSGAPPSARAAAAWLAGFAAAGLHLDPLVSDEAALPGGLIVRRDAAPLASRVTRAFARVIAERHAANADRAAIAEVRDAHERVRARAAQLDDENRVLRSQIDSLERENRSLASAMRDVGAVLTDELEAVKRAEQTVADDIAALHGSSLWQLKLRLAGKDKQGGAS